MTSCSNVFFDWQGIIIVIVGQSIIYIIKKVSVAYNYYMYLYVELTLFNNINI